MLTVFLLPQGKFYYKLAPMGLSHSGEWLCQRSNEALAGLPGVLKMALCRPLQRRRSYSAFGRCCRDAASTA